MRDKNQWSIIRVMRLPATRSLATATALPLRHTPGTWPRALLVAFLVVTALLAGCNGPAGDTYRIDRGVDLSPMGYAEVNLIMAKADSFTATFNASAAVFWDIHSHDGRDVVTHQSGHDANGTLEFTAPGDDVFSILWENDGGAPTIELGYVVDGQGSLHSIHPSE